MSDLLHLHRTSLVKQWHPATDRIGFSATCTCGWNGSLRVPDYGPNSNGVLFRASAVKAARESALDEARHHFAAVTVGDA